MDKKVVVTDANILIRAVLGKRVRQLIYESCYSVDFIAPDIAFEEAGKYLPSLIEKRGLASDAAMLVFEKLANNIESIDFEVYADMKSQALDRIAIRDADDWPVLACAMRFDCPVWTEDTDFFGSGVATWTTDRIALYFSN